LKVYHERRHQGHLLLNLSVVLFNPTPERQNRVKLKPETKIGAQLFYMMFLQWAILTVNFRAVAHGSYLWLALTDIVTALLSFTVMKKVQEATNVFQMMCYTVGGTLGSQLALLLSVLYLK
jgi:hypothetical protein